MSADPEQVARASGARGRFRTLVVQPLPGIGDMIWHLPHLHAIAAASADGRVSLLAKPRSRADVLLRADPAIDEVIWVERNPGRHDGLLGCFRLADLLRGFGFQRVWVLHDSVRYVCAAWLGGIPERFAYGFGRQRWFQSSAVRLPSDADRHPIAKADRLLELHGLKRTEPEPVLPVDQSLVQALAERFPAAQSPWLALGIGSSESYKQWGQERFAELIRRLRARRALSVLIMGGGTDTPAAQWIAAQAGGSDVYDATDLPVDVSASLLSRCRLYVGNDTGFLNMAAAVGVDAIGLFGGSPPLRHSQRIHVVLPEGVGEPGYGDPYMERISVDAVVCEADRLLER